MSQFVSVSITANGIPVWGIGGKEGVSFLLSFEEIEDIVKNNEPHLALYGGDDGLDCYRKILANVKDHMKERCIIAFEIGYKQAKSIEEIAKTYLENIRVEVKKDLSDKDRMLFIFKNIE